MTELAGGITGYPEQVDWEQLLLVYLHEPVDKALDILDHEARGARYASCALGREVNSSDIKILASQADELAAVADRIPLPSKGCSGERAVSPENGRLEIRHPVSAEKEIIESLAIDECAVKETISEIVQGIDDPRSRFLAIWRLLPERLEKRVSLAFVRQPADARIPDHTIFHHIDIACGLWASRSRAHGGAYLSLSLGPVQEFIAAARTVRDLWSGSAILSWLTFQGMIPVIERLGPTALVFPAVRGNPLMDLWLRREARLDDRIELPADDTRRSPSVPNRFVALVPWGSDGVEGRAMAALCENAVRDAWKRLSEEVLTRIDPELGRIDAQWAKRWRQQADEFFEVRCAVMPDRPLSDQYLAELFGKSESFESIWPEAAKVRGLASCIPIGHRPVHDQQSSGRWQAQLEASARLMEAQRAIRHVPSSREAAPSPPKCSLLGSFEQLGPEGLDDGRRFWEEVRKRLVIGGARLRARERFSAIAMCKRFAAPTTLAKEFELDASNFRFPDTATIAASDWLRRAQIEPEAIRHETGDWNGRWLHQDSREAVEDDERPPPRSIWGQIDSQRKNLGRPPTYYALLMMDADDMGIWLRGDLAPRLRDVLHPNILRYYEGLGENTRPGLDALRPVGPALHASISDALNYFASKVAPAIVRKNSGTIIYSGGDDVLAVMPARRAVTCANDLQNAFRGVRRDNRDAEDELVGPRFLTMGKNATMSAGIAFVHVKEDLRLALQSAREAENAAKESGKNALALRFIRRSGEDAEVILEWDMACWFNEMVSMFACGATDRWAYRLRSELPTLEGNEIPQGAIGAEIRRLVDRASEDGGTTGTGLTGKAAENWWLRFADPERCRNRSAGELLAEFVKTCQGASFIARGKDV